MNHRYVSSFIITDINSRDISNAIEISPAWSWWIFFTYLPSSEGQVATECKTWKALETWRASWPQTGPKLFHAQGNQNKKQHGSPRQKKNEKITTLRIEIDAAKECCRPTWGSIPRPWNCFNILRKISSHNLVPLTPLKLNFQAFLYVG